MRLLNVYTLEFCEFHGDHIPPYVVTSHRWTTDEASYKDVLKRKNQDSKGYNKILNFCSFARPACKDANGQPIQWIWIDTCCINQNSSAEVSESINSMWVWYSQATHCIAYLRDVRSVTSSAGLDGVMFDFRRSEWFERGWTLQELLAPHCVVFVTREWEVIGHKSPDNHSCILASVNLNRTISEITGISQDVLWGFESQRDTIGKEMKMAWAANRRTTKAEDVAYCLLGIFGIHMALIYGEGEHNARKRLEQEIRNREREEQQESEVDSIMVPRTRSTDIAFGGMQSVDGPAQRETAERPKGAGIDESCPLCARLLYEPVTTSCHHRCCEHCLIDHSHDDLILLFEPLDSAGKAEGQAAIENFGTMRPCPVCKSRAYVWRNLALTHYLQTKHTLKYTERAAEVNGSDTDAEILTIHIGNWHELVAKDAHRWNVFVKPSRTDIIKDVHVQLHESFANREKHFSKPPYKIHGKGWGFFRFPIYLILKSGYEWVCEEAEDGPDGSQKAQLGLNWTLDFESHNGRGSMGRCRVKVRKSRSRVNSNFVHAAQRPSNNSRRPEERDIAMTIMMQPSQSNIAGLSLGPKYTHRGIGMPTNNRNASLSPRPEAASGGNIGQPQGHDFEEDEEL